VAARNSAATTIEKPADRVLNMSRVFDAPRSLVFKVWTQPEHLVRWWGCPRTKSATCKIDPRKGGAFRVVMRLEDGTDHRVSGVYKDVTPPERLVFTWAWEDADGNRGHETLVTVTFAEQGGKTKLTLRQEVFESAEMCDLHREGWTASLERMVAEIAAARAA
jgi:uncharacterized protein YndB with AHSA1/START domain